MPVMLDDEGGRKSVGDEEAEESERREVMEEWVERLRGMEVVKGGT
jgi:hypothetical protein